MAELLGRLRAALRRVEGELGRDRPHQVTIGHWLGGLTAHQARAGAAGRVAAHRGTGHGAAVEGSLGLAEGGAADGGWAEGATLRLTPTEWRILTILLDRPGPLLADRKGGG